MTNVAMEMEAFEKTASGDGGFLTNKRNYNNSKMNENNVCNDKYDLCFLLYSYS